MARKPRIIQTELPYHITCRTNNQAFRFRPRLSARIFAYVINRAMKKYNVTVHHFVLMSNHYHLVAWANEPNIHRFMQYVNSMAARIYNRRSRRSGHLWGSRYCSCIVDTDDYYLACLRYLYRNPVRAGMVERAPEHPDSTFSFVAFGRRVEMEVVEDHLVLSFGKNRGARARFFLQLVEEEGEPVPEAEVARGLKKLFFGSADFIEQMRERYGTC